MTSPASEVGVTTGDDRSDEAAVVRIVEEFYDLYGDGFSLFTTDGYSPAVGGAYEDVWLIYDEFGLVGSERDADVGQLELVYKTAGVFGC